MSSIPRSLSAGVLGALILLGFLTPWAGEGTAALDADADPRGTVRVVVADETGRAASDRVAAMSTREKAASVVMGHIPTTDAAALVAYMAGTGIGGFILMGANIPASEAELRSSRSADARCRPAAADRDRSGGRRRVAAAVGRIPVGAHPEGSAR